MTDSQGGNGPSFPFPVPKGLEALQRLSESLQQQGAVHDRNMSDAMKSIEERNRRQADADEAQIATVQFAQATADRLAKLLENQDEAEARETKMLFWTRLAGIAALIGLVATIVVAIIAA